MKHEKIRIQLPGSESSAALYTFMRKAAMVWLLPMKKPVTRTVMVFRKNARAG